MAEFFTNLIAGITFALTLKNIIGILVGYLIGVVAGSIPGLMATTAMVLLLPFTFALDPLFAIAALMGCYKGGVYAGSITGTLFNIPGTPEAAATALDSYPLAQKGEELRALEIDLYASMAGGTFANFLLLFMAPPLAAVALKLGPAEVAALIFFSLTAVVSLMGDTRMEIWKGTLAVSAGLFMATIGLDAMTTTRRYGFGIEGFDKGISFITTIIALLALSEVFIQAENVGNLEIHTQRSNRPSKVPTLISRIQDLKTCAVDIIRSSIIGSILGALPGIGATTAAFISYGEAKRNAKDQSLFGKGDIRGIAAPEAGNNAVCASSLIPLVTLGIPGSVAAAVLFGAFMVQGMIPGPMLMKTNPEVLYGLFFLMILTDILGGFIVAYPFIFFVRSAFRNVNYSLLFPAVAVLCGVGVYAEAFDIFDIKVLIALGVLGYLMKKAQFSIPPFVLAYILGPILERNTRTALLISQGSPKLFLQSPIAMILLVSAVVALVWSFKRKSKTAKSTGKFMEEI